MGSIFSIIIAAAALAGEGSPETGGEKQFTPAELRQRREALSAVFQAAEEAELNLPPCAGLDRVSEAALRYEPARDCPLAQNFEQHILKLDRELRDGCRALEQRMETVLRDPAYCAHREKEGWLNAQEEKINEIKREHTAWFEEPFPDISAAAGGEFVGERPAAKGEFSRMSCALPVMIGMQFRKKQLTLFNQIFGEAGGALSESCSGEDKAGASFLRYLRGGRKEKDRR